MAIPVRPVGSTAVSRVLGDLRRRGPFLRPEHDLAWRVAPLDERVSARSIGERQRGGDRHLELSAGSEVAHGSEQRDVAHRGG